nr:hypothetical protein [Tanacetum cinerariifolium]
MGRDTIQLETVVSTISQEYLLEFTSEYGISEDLHLELPDPEERIMDFSKGKQTTRKKHPSVLYQTFGFLKIEQSILLGRLKGRREGLPSSGSLQGNLHSLYFLLSRTGTYGFVQFDLCSNPTKVKIGTRPRAAHEVPLLTVTVSHVIEMEDLAKKIDSSGIPSSIERTTRVAPETGLVEKIATMGPRVIKECRKRRNDGVDVNAPPKVLRKNHADSRPTQSTVGEKSLSSMGLEMGSTFLVPTPWETHADVSDLDPLSFTNPQSSKGAAVAGDQESENTSYTSMVGSPESIYQPEWDVTNGCRLDTPKVCQDLVGHIVPPGYFLEMRHLHNDDFLSQYNLNLARQVAMGSQLRLRFEQEAKLLKKFVAQIARRDQMIQAKENEIKNLEALLEAETDMKKATEAKNAELVKELENLRAYDRRSQMELRKVFADVVSAGIAKGMSEGLKYGVEDKEANLDLEAIEAYDLEADTKYVAALHALMDLKYPMVDQLESLKDALIDVMMVSLHLESDSGEDAPQSDGVLVSMPIVAPQGLAILLVDVAPQTEISKDGASPRLLRSKYLPSMYNLDWS